MSGQINMRRRKTTVLCKGVLQSEKNIYFLIAEMFSTMLDSWQDQTVGLQNYDNSEVK